MAAETREHRLRNELNVISMGLMVLRQELGASPRQDIIDIVARMERAAGACTAMIGQAPPLDARAD